MLLMTVSSATLSVAQNVAKNVAKIGTTEYATLKAAVYDATAGQTVTLINDVDLTTDDELEVGKLQNIVLDMNGYSIKGANADHKNICVSSGKLTLMDSKENSTGRIYAETPYQEGIYDKPLVEVINGGEFVMESGHINSVPAGNHQFVIGAYYDSKVIINGGTIESGWYAINGSNDEYQSPTITINGGTLVSTSSYAISHPQSGTLTINKGVVYGAGGAIDMKRGNLVVYGGIMTSKGKGDTGKWGEGTGDPDKAALNFCKPYGNVTATIKGGTITAAGDAVLTDDQPTEGKTVALAIEGGKYSSDVSKYCSSGYTATPNADGTYTVAYFGNVVLVVYDNSNKTIVEAGGTLNIDMDQVNKIWVPEAGVTGVNTTLTKNYTNTGWNSFFVPFDFTLTEKMLNDFEFATLYATALENGNGSPAISYKMAKAGDKIAAFYPCLIKAKATGELKLNVSEVDYKSIKGVTPKDCSSIPELYTFHPVMENTYIAAKHGYYLKSEQNSFVYNTHPEAYIQPLRYYMTIQDRGDMSYIEPANGGASKVKICVIGEDEPTGITDLVDEAANASGKIYNLQGVVVGNTTEGLPKGVYIKNRRKIIVK